MITHLIDGRQVESRETFSTFNPATGEVLAEVALEKAIHELLEINTALAESLARKNPAEFVAAARVSMAGHTLRDQAIALARTGVTSLAEAMRASAQDETS